MKLLGFLKRHLGAVVICFALICGQAYFQLMLPTAMSDIVDVGIQQGGIDSPVPHTIRATALNDLEMFMSESDAAKVDGVYGPANGNGVRTFIGNQQQASAEGEIAQLIAVPECVALSLEKGIDASALSLDSGTSMEAPRSPLPATITLDEVRQLFEAGLIGREELAQDAQKMMDAMGSVAGSMVDQRAVDYVRAEYEAQGLDLNEIQTNYLGTMALSMLWLCVGMVLCSVSVSFVAAHTSARVARELRSELFSKVMDFGPGEVNKFSQASLITRTTNDVQQVQMTAFVLLRMVMMAPVLAVLALIQVWSMASGLEWTIGVAVLAIAAVMGTLLGLTMPKFKRMQALVDRVNLVARDMLDGLMPIRAYGREDFELERFGQANRDLMKTQLFTNSAMAFAMPAIMLVMNLVSLLIVWSGAGAIDAGNLQVGTMIAFISYAMEIVMSFMILAMVLVMLPRAEVSAERIDEVLVCPVAVQSPAQPKALPASERGVLTFDDVSFTYPDATHPVVEHVSFRTEPGHTTALIGSTGSGKSTLVALIPRLYDATSGAISLDGVDVRSLELAELRDRVGYVPQQGLLFSGTIASNVKFAGDQVSDEDMGWALDVAQAKDFVDQTEDGVATAIAQKGSNVSGGQRQRLSIARALAKDPEVLVFDDSFSALDYATDAKLRHALADQVKEAAVVIVAQRVATIMGADEILVLDEGTVCGRGTHEDLLRCCPTYLEIATSQLSLQELGLTQDEVDAVLGTDESRQEAAIGQEVHDLASEIASSETYGSALEGGER